MSFDNIYLKGSTSVIVQIMMRDSTTGQGKTGLTNATVTAYYVRPGGTATSISLIAGAAGDAYSSGKFAEVDATNMPGVYQVHLPVGCLATGANVVDIEYRATGVINTRQKIVLIDSDLRNAITLGLSSLPSATAGAVSGLVINDATVAYTPKQLYDETAAQDVILSSVNTQQNTIGATVAKLEKMIESY